MNSMQSIRVREAVLSDVTPMVKVMVDSFLAAHHGQVPEALWQWRKQQWTYLVAAQGWESTIRRIDEAKHDAASRSQECVFVAEDSSGNILGLGMAQPTSSASTAEVGALYVHTECQRQGIGGQLLAALAAHLQSCGVTSLQIGTLTTNAPARRFYETLGGQSVEERDIEDGGAVRYTLREVVYRWPNLERLVMNAWQQDQPKKEKAPVKE